MSSDPKVVASSVITKRGQHMEVTRDRKICIGLGGIVWILSVVFLTPATIDFLDKPENDTQKWAFPICLVLVLLFVIFCKCNKTRSHRIIHIFLGVTLWILLVTCLTRMTSNALAIPVNDTYKSALSLCFALATAFVIFPKCKNTGSYRNIHKILRAIFCILITTFLTLTTIVFVVRLGNDYQIWVFVFCFPPFTIIGIFFIFMNTRIHWNILSGLFWILIVTSLTLLTMAFMDTSGNLASKWGFLLCFALVLIFVILLTCKVSRNNEVVIYSMVNEWFFHCSECVTTMNNEWRDNADALNNSTVPSDDIRLQEIPNSRRIALINHLQRLLARFKSLRTCIF